MQINRLFEIVYLLMDKKSMTANELATHFEVSKRTILRDVDVLTTAGIPIYTMQGKGGGISILDKFVLNKTVLSKDEQQQILFALQGIAATGYIETENVLGRLRSLFERKNKDWIEVDFSRWGNSESDKNKFDILKNAAINERVISFTYSSSYDTIPDRKAYPLKLLFKSKSWYLQSFCLMKNDYRTFKITQMNNIETLTDTFDGSKFQNPILKDFKYNAPVIDAKLYFSPNVAYRAYDEFDEQYITKNDDSSVILSINMPEDWLYDYILSFGLAAEVLEPQSARDEIVRRAEEIRNKYLNKT